MMNIRVFVVLFIAYRLLFAEFVQAQPKDGDIIHDAEHYVLLDQHAERWAEEDKRNTLRLKELREKNGASHLISSTSSLMMWDTANSVFPN
jgi:hypothetical protein